MASFKGRTRTILLFGAITSLLLSCYMLIKFSNYETNVTNLINGKHKNVITGQLVEAKLKAAGELIDISVSSEEANNAFKEKLKDASEELKKLELDDIQKLTLDLMNSDKNTKFNEDLFVSHRNLKTAVFNLYRNAWNNKWMGVAKTMGLVINDMDNTPYHSASSVSSGIYTKILSLTAYVSTSAVPQDSKLFLLNQLSFLKQRVSQYDEQIKEAQSVKAQRKESLAKIVNQMKQYNEKHSKSFRSFNDEARADYFKAFAAFLCLVMFSGIWFFASSSSLNTSFNAFITNLKKQFNEWVSPTGAFTVQELKKPTDLDQELATLYTDMSTVMSRLYVLRREELLIKRLLNVPFILVNKSKQATYWNSALSILGKVRALEELGATSYQNLLKVTDGKGTLIDPVSRCFLELREINQLGLLKVAQDSIAVFVSCTPVFSQVPSGENAKQREIDYVMVHIRDLREENRRTEREIERQLIWVKQVSESQGDLQSVPKPENLSKPAEIVAKLLFERSVEQKAKNQLLQMQVESLHQSLERELQIKKSVSTRTSELHSGVEGVVSKIQQAIKHNASLSTKAKRFVEYSDDMNEYGRNTYESNTRITEKFTQLKGNLTQLKSDVANIGGLNSRTRKEEENLKAMLKNTLMVNINNSILAGKDDLTPMDVAAFSDYVGQIIRQFERSIQIFEKSIDEVDTITSTLVNQVEAGLKNCSEVLVDEEAIKTVLQRTSKMIKAATKSYQEFFQDINKTIEQSAAVNSEIKNLSTKTEKLVQIGETSLSLQEHMIQAFTALKTSISAKIQTNNKETKRSA